MKRLSGAPQASAQAMGRRGGQYSRRQGARTARNLKRAGVNVNLAPVVGRLVAPGSVIRAQRRSFAGKPRRVIRTAIRVRERDGSASGVSGHGKALPRVWGG